MAAGRSNIPQAPACPGAATEHTISIQALLGPHRAATSARRRSSQRTRSWLHSTHIHWAERPTPCKRNQQRDCPSHTHSRRRTVTGARPRPGSQRQAPGWLSGPAACASQRNRPTGEARQCRQAQADQPSQSRPPTTQVKLSNGAVCPQRLITTKPTKATVPRKPNANRSRP